MLEFSKNENDIYFGADGVYIILYKCMHAYGLTSVANLEDIVQTRPSHAWFGLVREWSSWTGQNIC